MSEVLQRNREEVEAIAEAKGLICIFPEDDELQIDLDKGAVINETVVKVLADNGLHITDVIITVSRGGNKHHHMKLSRRLAGPAARIAFQAALGSDPVRESLAMLRRLNESTHPLALFETPLQAKRVTAWREKYASKNVVLADILDDIPY